MDLYSDQVSFNDSNKSIRISGAHYDLINNDAKYIYNVIAIEDNNIDKNAFNEFKKQFNKKQNTTIKIMTYSYNNKYGIFATIPSIPSIFPPYRFTLHNSFGPALFNNEQTECYFYYKGQKFDNIKNNEEWQRLLKLKAFI